ncbi:A24 family peptidase [Proteus sp. FME41]|uniref:prepilin peptidase n=1 Tax=Proteus sp. FME41 TaxID=2742608 RepID=UPI0018676B05|nr:A24 family peptidase [Proteus sp. FME41]
MPFTRLRFEKFYISTFFDVFGEVIKSIVPLSLLFLLPKSRRYQLVFSYFVICLYWGTFIYSFSLFVILSILSFYLLTLSFFDADYFLLPNNLTFWLIFLGLLCNYTTFGLVPFDHAFYGFLAGTSVFYGVYLWGYFIYQKCVLGFGDIKLFSAIGAWCGFEALPYILLLGSFLGVGIYCTVLITTKEYLTKVALGSCLSFSTLMILGLYL